MNRPEDNFETLILSFHSLGPQDPGCYALRQVPFPLSHLTAQKSNSVSCHRVFLPLHSPDLALMIQSTIVPRTPFNASVAPALPECPLTLPLKEFLWELHCFILYFVNGE